LINKKVTHKVFGEGNIIEQDDSIITIDFDKDLKKFVYPDAFQSFITLNDEKIAEVFEEVFSKRMKEEEARQERLEEERRQRALEQERRDLLKNHKIHESSQIVFWLDEEEQENVFTEWQ